MLLAVKKLPAKNIKISVTPLKTLNWDKIPDAEIENVMWKEWMDKPSALETQVVSDLNKEEFEELFGIKSKPKNKLKDVEGVEGSCKS